MSINQFHNRTFWGAVVLNISEHIDIFAKREYNYTYEEGRIVRATENSITVASNETVTSKTLDNSIIYVYDSEGRLAKKRILPANGKEQTVYYEYPENENAVVRFEAGGRVVTSHSKTDSFGRKEFDELQLGTGFVSRKFSYHAGAATDDHKDGEKLKSSPTTRLVSEIVMSDGRTISYEYDAEERITKVNDSADGATTYEYDALGQLVTEKKNGRSVNSMSYDHYGNILSKNGNQYIYDKVWKDRLTRYNGCCIEYDEQGNPTDYLDNILEWEKGRQLKSFNGIQYTYNANGIRTSKTLNGVKHTYTLDGAKILRETWGRNTLVPLYDNEESVCGIVYNGEPYYFYKNLQGDVISIADKDGFVVAKYSYDAWGKCEITRDFTGFIASVNPFRYRGYYYDSEIALYYVNSRYYDPEVGRWINADNSAYAINQLGSTEHNLFVYCNNDPNNSVDIDGFFTIKIYAIAAVTAAVIAAIAKIVGNYAKGYRGQNLFRGVLGASIGSAVNIVLLMKLLKWGTKGMVLAAFAAAAVQAVFDFAEGVLIDKKYNWKQLTYDFVLNFASTFVGNYIGGKCVYINENWFQPQKLGSFFTKSYGKRLIAQTGIGAVISLLIDLIRTGLEKISKK